MVFSSDRRVLSNIAWRLNMMEIKANTWSLGLWKKIKMKNKKKMEFGRGSWIVSRPGHSRRSQIDCNWSEKSLGTTNTRWREPARPKVGRSFEIFTSLLYLFLLLYFILFYFPFYVFFFSKYYSPSLSYSFFIPLQRRFHYLLLVLIRKSKLSWSKKVDIISFKAYHPATKNIQKEIHKKFAIFLRVYFVNIK